MLLLIFAEGDLDISHSSKASVGGFNWWSHALTESEMTEISCRGTKGDVLTQDDLDIMGTDEFYTETFCCPSEFRLCDSYENTPDLIDIFVCFQSDAEKKNLDASARTDRHS